MIKEGLRKIVVHYCYYNGNNLDDVEKLCKMATATMKHDQYFVDWKDGVPYIRSLGPFHDMPIGLKINHFVVQEDNDISIVDPPHFKYFYIEGKPMEVSHE